MGFQRVQRSRAETPQRLASPGGGALCDGCPFRPLSLTSDPLGGWSPHVRPASQRVRCAWEHRGSGGPGGGVSAWVPGPSRGARVGLSQCLGDHTLGSQAGCSLSLTWSGQWADRLRALDPVSSGRCLGTLCSGCHSSLPCPLMWARIQPDGRGSPSARPGSARLHADTSRDLSGVGGLRVSRVLRKPGFGEPGPHMGPSHPVGRAFSRAVQIASFSGLSMLLTEPGSLPCPRHCPAHLS